MLKINALSSKENSPLRIKNEKNTTSQQNIKQTNFLFDKNTSDAISSMAKANISFKAQFRPDLPEDISIQKEKEAKEYLKGVIKDADNEFANFEQKMENYVDFYSKWKKSTKRRFSDFISPDRKAILRFESVNKGGKTYTTLREYRGPKLAREVEYAPQRYIIIREYLNDLKNYNLYEKDYETKRKQFSRNVVETGTEPFPKSRQRQEDDQKRAYEISKVYSWDETNDLIFYDEGVSMRYEKGELTHKTIEKQYELHSDTGIAQYREDCVERPSDHYIDSKYSTSFIYV